MKEVRLPPGPPLQPLPTIRKTTLWEVTEKPTPPFLSNIEAEVQRTDPIPD